MMAHESRGSSKPRILIQLDPDPQPSVFDSVVAIDSGVDQLLSHGGVQPSQVRDLIYGAIFTRGTSDLRYTAVFVGGSDVAVGEQLLGEVTGAFLGPLRVSVMFDANGANTTAAAAVLAASRHVSLSSCTATVLAGTGPVGQRAARLLARQGAQVRLASRRIERAREVVQHLAEQFDVPRLEPVQTATTQETKAALQGAELVIAAGAAGVSLVEAAVWKHCQSLKVAIDLNAVPPAGIEAIEVTDHAQQRGPATCYGAIGVGGLKMKIHKTAVAHLFSANDLVLDAEQIFSLGQQLESGR